MKYLTCFITLSFPVFLRIGYLLSYVAIIIHFYQVLHQIFIHSYGFIMVLIIWLPLLWSKIVP